MQITQSMRPRLIYQNLEILSKFDSVEDRVTYLKAVMSPGLQKLIEVTYHPVIVWELPEGIPSFVNHETRVGLGNTNLHRIARNYPLWVSFKGTDNPMLIQKKSLRESKFINILQELQKQEAEILLAAKDRNLNKWKLSQHIAHLLFPQGIPDGPDYGEAEVIGNEVISEAPKEPETELKVRKKPGPKPGSKRTKGQKTEDKPESQE